MEVYLYAVMRFRRQSSMEIMVLGLVMLLLGSIVFVRKMIPLGPRAGGVAAGQMRLSEQVNCMYPITTGNEEDYLYLEVGMPVSKKVGDVNEAEEVWDRWDDTDR
jgi:hypothetical protein